MLLLATAPRTETEIPSRRQGGRITRAAALFVARFFLTFPEKTSKNHRHFLTIPENICSLFI